MGSYIVKDTKEHLSWYVSAETVQEAKEGAAKFGYDIQNLTARRATSREVYLHNVPDMIENYRKGAARFQVSFNVLQIIIIILSSLVSGIGWFASRWIVSLLGIAITIATGINLHFKYREKYYNLRQTADQMEVEYNAYKLDIGQYVNEAVDDDESKFIRKFEYLREEQQKRQLQMEQSSHTDQKPLNANQ